MFNKPDAKRNISGEFVSFYFIVKLLFPTTFLQGTSRLRHSSPLVHLPPAYSHHSKAKDESSIGNVEMTFM